MIEKIKPIEARLKYQIDKLIRTATVDKVASVQGKVDPLTHKPNAANLAPKLTDDVQHGQGGGQGGEAGGDGAYVPPKMSAMHYDEDDSAAVRREKRAPFLSHANRTPCLILVLLRVAKCTCLACLPVWNGRLLCAVCIDGVYRRGACEQRGMGHLFSILYFRIMISNLYIESPSQMVQVRRRSVPSWGTAR